MNPYLNQYKQNSVLTASPETILIMLYDGAINFLLRAKFSIDEKNIEETHTYITKTQKIIRELMRTIDLENGNVVSKQLFKLYNRMAMNLIKANVSRRAELIDNVIEDLSNIRWGFQKAIEIQSGITTVEEVMKERTERENSIVNGESVNAGSTTI